MKALVDIASPSRAAEEYFMVAVDMLWILLLTWYGCVRKRSFVSTMMGD